MAHNDNHHPGRQQLTAARIRAAIAVALDGIAVIAHLAGWDLVALIAHLVASGLHWVDDDLPRTRAAVVLTAIEIAAVLAHLAGLHDLTLILHLAGCVLRLLLSHPYGAAAIRSAKPWIARTTNDIAGRVRVAVKRTKRWIRDRLHRDR
ncbi:hypothetical protein ACTD5D_21000 [Nocardia takedensis]|uniref:hypothetical protein n=1 Tax=Nocardia takedensis TaxID=259390 RepID=UPI003F76D534